MVSRARPCIPPHSTCYRKTDSSIVLPEQYLNQRPVQPITSTEYCGLVRHHIRFSHLMNHDSPPPPHPQIQKSRADRPHTAPRTLDPTHMPRTALPKSRESLHSENFSCTNVSKSLATCM
ncbi:hypothetical protein M438DRAFT_126373 [Aureobasidium pullulans EXF-150]|uniref:Uncharacterized protein n=1 Tax=Aureobasidium pullulans EXF-150 TaxID=1043002 RepID=A0A074XV62_AURPU|nr:uncharacterized protein M438DRAFT_126373 [Aureobasidium pullulans EXF-150]KEQ87509.1 hypothetical protein M438DRAFT_126373 [Aureobasidium pullulans EXF-150]